MAPALAVVAFTALGGGTYLLFKRMFGRSVPDAPLPGSLPGATATLKKGSLYAVLVQLTGGTTADGQSLPNASQKMRQIFEQSGFSVLSDPQPRDGDNAAAFVQGKPSTWVFNGRWTLDAPIVDASTFPTNEITMVQTVLLPSS